MLDDTNRCALHLSTAYTYLRHTAAMTDDFVRVREVREKQKEMRALLKDLQKLKGFRGQIKALRLLARARALDQEIQQEIRILTNGGI